MMNCRIDICFITPSLKIRLFSIVKMLFFGDWTAKTYLNIRTLKCSLD